MQQEATTHQRQFDFCVDRLTIEIRFPCRITFSVRIGKEQTFSQESVALDSGRAEFLQPVSVLGRLFHLEGSYQQKKCYLTIYVESSSGRNIAGVCTLDLAAYIGEQWITVERQLERCPDRNARISLRVRSALIRELDENPSESSHTDLTGSWPRIAQQSGERLPASFKQNLMGREPKTMTNLRMEASQAREISNNSRKLDDQKSSIQSARAKTRNDESERSRAISDLKNAVNDKDRKLARLEIQKQSLSKEAEGLRQQLETFRLQLSVKSSREIELVGDNERLKRKLESSESSLDILKLKKTEWQKKDSERRQSALVERNLSEELQTLTMANAQLEKEVKLSKKAREELDKLLREKMRELREALEKSDDLSNMVTTLEKRLEMKEGFYKQEIRKFNEKQTAAEAERQRLWAELNHEKELAEQKQRRSVQGYRDNQKSWFEERSKLIKKAEQLRQQLQSTTLLQDNYFKQIEQQTDTIEKMGKQLTLAEDEKVNLIAELERNRKQLAQEIGFRQKYDEQLREKSSLRQQKAVLEKQLEQFVSEKSLGHSESTRQLVERNDALKLANEKLAELNRRLREKDQKILEIQTNLQAQVKKNDGLRKAEERRTSEVGEFKISERQLQAEIKELQKNNQHLELSLQDEKFKHENQLEQLRKLVKKAMEQTEGLKMRLRGEVESGSKLDDNLKVMTEKYSATLESNGRLEERLKKLELQLMEGSFREKDLKDQLDRATLSLYDTKESLKKQISKNDENYVKIGKLESEYIRLSYAQEQLGRVEKQLKEREAELTERRNNETSLELNVHLQESSMSSLKEQLKTKLAELLKQKSMTEGLRKDLAAAIESGQSTQRQLQEQAAELAEVKKEFGRTQVEKKNLEEKLTATVAEHKKSRNATIESMKSFTQALFSGKEPVIYENDFEMGEVQRQLQRKHRRLIEHQSADIELCKQHLSEITRDQLAAAERRHVQMEQELRGELETKRQEFHYFREGMLVKQDELTRNLQETQQHLQETQAQVTRLEQLKDELQKQIRRLLLENEEAVAVGDQRKRELANLSADIKQLSEQIVKERQMKDEIFTKIYSEREQTHSQMQEVERALHLQIQQMEIRLREKEEIISGLNQQIRALNKELEQRTDTIRAGERELQKSVAANQQLESKLANQEKKERELLERIRQGEQSLQLEQEKLAHARSNLSIIQVKEREIEEMRVAFDREREALLNKIQYCEKVNRTIEQNNTIFKQEALQLQEDLGKAHGEIRRLTETARNLQEAISKKSLSLDEKTVEIAAMKDRIQRLEKEVQVKQESRDEQSKRLQTTINNISLEKEELLRRIGHLEIEQKKQLQTKAGMVRDFERELSRRQSENQSLLSKVSELQTSLSNTSSVVGTLNKKEQDMLADVQHLQQIIQQLELGNGKLHFELEVREHDINQISRRFEILEQEHRNQHLMLKQREIDIADLTARLSSAAKERDSLYGLTSQKDDLSREIASARGKYNELEATHSQLKQHCQSLQMAIDKYKQDKQFLYRQLKDELERSNQLIRDKDDLKQGYELKLNGSTKDYQQEKKNMILAQNENVQRIAKLTSQNNRLDIELKELQRKLAASSTVSDQASSAKVTKLEQENRELKDALNRFQHKSDEEKRQIEQSYDAEFRQVEARRQQEVADQQEKVKRVYRQKFEDEAQLKFEIQRLKAELANTTAGRQRGSMSPSTLALNLKQYRQEVADVKMKHFLTEEPLRTMEALLPHIIWLFQESEAASKLGGSQIKVDSEILDKLRQTETNCRLTKQRMAEMAAQFQQINEQRVKVLSKARELMDMLREPALAQHLLIDKVSEILDYSRIKKEVSSPPSTDRSINIQRVQSGGRVVNAEMWYRQKPTDKLEVRRVQPQQPK